MTRRWSWPRSHPRGPAVITTHLEHLLGHGEQDLYRQAIGYLNEHNIPIPPQDLR
jgi:hypothetical protein